MMKKFKWHEVLIIMMITIAGTLVVLTLFNSCTKEPDMIQTPEPYLIIDKTVKFEGQKRVGESIKFWVDMPEPYTNNLQWYFNYGSSTGWSQGGDTIYHTYNKSGVYYVRVVGWNNNTTKLGLSDAVKLQILD